MTGLAAGERKNANAKCEALVLEDAFFSADQWRAFDTQHSVIVILLYGGKKFECEHEHVVRAVIVLHAT